MIELGALILVVGIVLHKVAKQGSAPPVGTHPSRIRTQQVPSAVEIGKEAQESFFVNWT